MSVPIIGAALAVPELADFRDWLLEKQRDLEIQSFHDPDVLRGDWTPLADEARKQLDGHTGRRGIHGPFWGFSLATMDPDVRAIVQARLMQGLDICAAVGATHMVVHSPVTTWDHHNMGNYDGAWDGILDHIHANLDTAVKRAEDQGVALVLENIEDMDPAYRRRIVEHFNSPALRLSIDTGHAHYAHGATGAPPVDYFIQDAGALLEHVHLQDAEGYADRHWAIGQGTIIWPAVFRALAALPVSPRLILELRDKAGIAPSMRYLEHHGLGQ